MVGLDGFDTTGLRAKSSVLSLSYSPIRTRIPALDSVRLREGGQVTVNGRR